MVTLQLFDANWGGKNGSRGIGTDQAAGGVLGRELRGGTESFVATKCNNAFASPSVPFAAKPHKGQGVEDGQHDKEQNPPGKGWKNKVFKNIRKSN